MEYFILHDIISSLHVFKCCEVRNKWREVISLPHCEIDDGAGRSPPFRTHGLIFPELTSLA